MPRGSWAYITFVDDAGGGHPDQGLPGGPPSHPGNRPPGSAGGPVDPGWGGGPPLHPGHRPPGSGGGHPDQGLPGQPPHAGHLPVWPVDPTHPIAPPSPGHELPPVDPPPGTIWPPLPPDAELPDGGKAVVLVAIEGVGYRYVVISIGDNVDNELPGEGEGEGEGEEGPDNELPGQRPPHVGNRPPGQGAPPRPDQGLPGGQPHPGNRPPGQGAPPRPGQGLPPAPGPKPGPAGRR
jgi:hypothetical protein